MSQATAQQIVSQPIDLPTEFIPIAVAVFFILIVSAVWNTHQRWNRIAIPFRSRTRLNHHKYEKEENKDYDRKKIRIDGRIFKNLVIIPTEGGLYLSHYGLLAELMMPKRVLIPWTSLSDIRVVERSVFGMTVSEYFVDTRGPVSVELYLPGDIAKEILQLQLLKKSER